MSVHDSLLNFMDDTSPSTLLMDDGPENTPIHSNLSKDLESFERGTAQREVSSTAVNTVLPTAKTKRKRGKQKHLENVLNHSGNTQKNKVTCYLSDDDLSLLEAVKDTYGMTSRQDAIRAALAALRDAIGVSDAST